MKHPITTRKRKNISVVEWILIFFLILIILTVAVIYFSHLLHKDNYGSHYPEGVLIDYIEPLENERIGAFVSADSSVSKDPKTGPENDMPEQTSVQP